MAKKSKIPAGILGHFVEATTEVERIRIIRDFLTQKEPDKGPFDVYRPLRTVAFECQTKDKTISSLPTRILAKYPNAPDFVISAANHLAAYAKTNAVSISKVKFWPRVIGGITVNVSPHALVYVGQQEHCVALLCDLQEIGRRRIGCLLNLLRMSQQSIFGPIIPGIVDVRREVLITGPTWSDDQMSEEAERFRTLMGKIAG